MKDSRAEFKLVESRIWLTTASIVDYRTEDMVGFNCSLNLLILGMCAGAKFTDYDTAQLMRCTELRTLKGEPYVILPGFEDV